MGFTRIGVGSRRQRSGIGKGLLSGQRAGSEKTVGAGRKKVGPEKRRD